MLKIMKSKGQHPLAQKGVSLSFLVGYSSVSRRHVGPRRPKSLDRGIRPELVATCSH
jgi:hypothetical protein